MPLNLSREDRRLVIAAATIFLLSAFLAILLSPPESETKFATSYSSASEGAKAAYLLLHESGYNITRWRRPPAELGDARGTLLIVTDPNQIPTQSERDALTKFVNDGGVLLLAGGFSQMFASDPGPVEIPLDEGWQKFQAQAPSAQAASAPEIKLDESAFWSKKSRGVALYGDGSHDVVMEYANGSGRVLWLASSSLISNAGLREPGNMEFLMSTASQARRVLWDEYFHGYRDAGDTAVSKPQLAWLFGQLGFIAVAILVTFSRRSGPQRSPRVISRMSPLEYVQALGELYEHAKAANVALDIAYERFRYTLAKRVGLQASATSEQFAAVVAERWAIDRQEFHHLLDNCESARFFEDLSQKEALSLIERLHEYSLEIELFAQATKEKQ